MGRTRDPLRDKARNIYNGSGKTLTPREIAQRLGVDAVKVRKWKTMDDWDNKKRSDKSKEPKKRPGAPLGNKNAVGNSGGRGAPIGNDYAVTHGAYQTIYHDTLSDEERELAEALVLDPKAIMADVYIDLAIKARRMKRKIAAEELSRGDLKLDGIVQEKTPQGKKTTTVTTSKFRRLMTLEQGLDITHARMIRLAETLAREQQQGQRFALDCNRAALDERRLMLAEQQARGELEIPDPDELDGVEVDDD